MNIRYKKRILDKWFDTMSKQKFCKEDTKSNNHKRKKSKLNFIKIKTSVLQKTLLRKLRTKQQYGRKYLPHIYMTRDSYTEYIKMSYNSIIRSKQFLKRENFVTDFIQKIHK